MSTTRTRVLVEHENPRVRRAQVATLEAAGYEVTECAGPASLEGGTCPLVERGQCEEARAADVVVNGLPLGELRVYIAQRARLDDGEVLLGLSSSERVRHPILDGLASSVPRNATGADLVEAVRSAAADPE